MSIYGINQMQVVHPYDVSGISIDSAYDINGDSVFEKELILGQEYIGGYIEIQPDSWDGVTPVTNKIVSNSDETAWGFPYSLSANSKKIIHDDILNGNRGILYIRFPLGFAYRGARNVDAATGLAKNFGERWPGQNSSLSDWFADIAKSGGGLAPEYWCLAPYWITTGDIGKRWNLVWAGGSYDRSVTLQSIKNSDPVQYNSQIDALTDAIVNDYEYLSQNVAPVVMYGLSNEPVENSGVCGTCKWDDETYSDVLSVLCAKMKVNFPNAKLHCSSDYMHNPWTIGQTFIHSHQNDIWGYSYHKMALISGENDIEGKNGAYAFYKSSYFKDIIKTNKTNVFNNEYEYFDVDVVPDELRCANNMVHLINELVYGEAEVLHPIIHICKPTGQSSRWTNTKGYCLFQVNMSDGSYTVNTWAYNSWKMFSDNLPIGARLVKNYFVDISGIGFMTVIKNNKLYVFVANCSSVAKTLTLGFFGGKTFQTKLYNMTNLGTVTGLSETITNLVVPANSGVCCIEN